MKLLRNARYENTGYRALLLLLLALLILSILTAVTFGTVDLSVQQVYAVILNKLFNTGYGALDIRRSTEDIVWLIRLPRVVLAMAVGIGLSVSGSIMQAVVKNPWLTHIS